MARAPARKSRKSTSRPKASKPRAGTPATTEQSNACPIVAMGASAGGLDAFQRFFSKMPSDSGMGFVLVPHLDVHHKSAMVDLLKAYTRMPVVEIRDRARVEPDRVHVIPPNA